MAQQFAGNGAANLRIRYIVPADLGDRTGKDDKRAALRFISARASKSDHRLDVESLCGNIPL